jgi:hypothetical protein
MSDFIASWQCGGRVTIPRPFRRNHLPRWHPRVDARLRRGMKRVATAGKAILGYQTFLKPAVMLFLLSVVPASSIDVVTLNEPGRLCSMLSLLCHC